MNYYEKLVTLPRQYLLDDAQVPFTTDTSIRVYKGGKGSQTIATKVARLLELYYLFHPSDKEPEDFEQFLEHYLKAVEDAQPQSISTEPIPLSFLKHWSKVTTRVDSAFVTLSTNYGTLTKVCRYNSLKALLVFHSKTGKWLRRRELLTALEENIKQESQGEDKGKWQLKESISAVLTTKKSKVHLNCLKASAPREEILVEDSMDNWTW